MQALIDDIIEFWFGDLDHNGMASPEKQMAWWTKDPDFDQEICDRFHSAYLDIVDGQPAQWHDSLRGQLALIIVLDQFTRNMFRDSPDMYAADPLALTTALQLIAEQQDRHLNLHERTFAYMPLMHSENLSHQDQCVSLFSTLRDSSQEAVRDAIASNVDFAIQHRDIIARFGRFPHRNILLGRPSTAEELEFLKQPGSSF